MHIFEEGGFLQEGGWKPIYSIMTNMGMFRCDKQRPLELLPKIMRLHSLKLTKIKGQYKGKRNIFCLDYINDKEKISQKYFSVDQMEHYEPWLEKIR